MIELTTEARARFDDYLRRLRTALRGTPAAEEVEQNVREHVEIALAGAAAPAGAEQLSQILDRLGPPERWLADEDKPLWRRMMGRLQSGPEDWRLAYLAFGVLVLMFLFFPVGGILLLIPAYLLSRACVEVIDERGETLGARRWLVYPALVAVLLFALTTLLIMPPAGLLAWAFDELRWPADVSSKFGVGLSAFGGWWIIAASLIAALISPIRFAFRPVLDRFQRRHAAVLALIGAVVAGSGVLLLVV